MMPMWCVADGVPMRDLPFTGRLVHSLAMYSIVEDLGQRETVRGAEFALIRFTNGQRNFEGWTYASYLAPFHGQREQVVKISNATPNPHDGAQYLIWRGKTQYNLCGFFAVAYCAGWGASIEDYLEMLTENKLSFMTRIFPAWQGRGTSIADLDIMLAEFEGYELPSRKIYDAMYDEVARRTLLNPERMRQLLSDHRVIYSVRIDKRTGYLNRSGVLHWVVLENVTPFNFRGGVELYNPWTNAIEHYSWHELVESGGVPYGILVKR